MTQSHGSGDRELEAAIDASLQNVPLGEIADEDIPPSGEQQRLHVGTVVGVSGSDVVVELGPRSQGVIPLEEFDEPPEVGSKLKVGIRGREDDLLLLSAREARALSTSDELEEGALVKARVTGLNKGGLEAKIGSFSAFLPASQISLGREEDLSAYAGETLVCEVLEIDRERRRVVLSRRRVLADELRRQREEGVDQLIEGAVLRGRVARMESWGAFVDLGNGIEGLVHVSNLSHRRVDHPQEILKVGQTIEVQVLEIKEGGRRIGLGTKQLEADPWEDIDRRFPVEHVFNGTVRRLTEFGAFVELVPGVEGLLHVSEMGAGRVRHARDILQAGTEITCRVIKLDLAARRISLSRLDVHGALLGADSAGDASVIDEVLEQSSKREIGTNLGSLLGRALKRDG